MEKREEKKQKLRQKNDELSKALEFKVEENAALKTIITNMDIESTKSREKVTNMI